MTGRLPPILLANAGYYGTLAAVRSLGRAGVPVYLAASARAPATWSRYVAERFRAPDLDDPQRFLDWLFDFGARHPGTVLYPTSDDAAWLYSMHRDELSRWYRMYQPPLETMRMLLDKRELLALCDRVGLAAPPTYFLRTDDRAPAPDGTTPAERGADAVGYPLLIKPRTQVLLDKHQKGCIVESRQELAGGLTAFGDAHRYHALGAAGMPEATQPMLQRYFPAAAEHIYSIAGFADDRGTLTALAATKVLQRPRKLGIGLCFESAPLDPELADRLGALTRAAGYRGVFEAEFIPADGRHLLIDFNPRFYSQMAFEIERGLPLAALAYDAAVGEPLLTAAMATRELDRSVSRAYTHGLVFVLLLAAQRLSGRMSAGEAAAWRAWRRSHRGRLTDAVLDRGDPFPFVGEVAARLWGYASHPAVSVRSMVFNR